MASSACFFNMMTTLKIAGSEDRTTQIDAELLAVPGLPPERSDTARPGAMAQVSVCATFIGAFWHPRLVGQIEAECALEMSTQV